jgi:hypothetical protein
MTLADHPFSVRNARWRTWLRARTPNVLYYQLGLSYPRHGIVGNTSGTTKGDGMEAVLPLRSDRVDAARGSVMQRSAHSSRRHQVTFPNALRQRRWLYGLAILDACDGIDATVRGWPSGLPAPKRGGLKSKDRRHQATATTATFRSEASTSWVATWSGARLTDRRLFSASAISKR